MTPAPGRTTSSVQQCATKQSRVEHCCILSTAVPCCRHAQLQHAVVLGGGVPLEDGLEALAARYYCQVCGVATTSETNLQVRPAWPGLAW